MRTKLVFALMAVVTVVYSIAVIIHMWLFRDREVFFLYARSWSRMLLRLSNIPLTVLGTRHLAPGTRYVYIANHNSLFDIPVVLAAVPDNIRIMYKQELERAPIFGLALKMSPFIAVNREKSREASSALEEAVETMRHGSSVLIFPEGTRSTTGELGAFRRGAIALAVRSETPIVPVIIEGTETIYPSGAKRLHPGTVKVTILESRSVGGVTTRAEEQDLVNTLRNIYVEHLNSPHDTRTSPAHR